MTFLKIDNFYSKTSKIKKVYYIIRIYILFSSSLYYIMYRYNIMYNRNFGFKRYKFIIESRFSVTSVIFFFFFLHGQNDANIDRYARCLDDDFQRFFFYYSRADVYTISARVNIIIINYVLLKRVRNRTDTSISSF